MADYDIDLVRSMAEDFYNVFHKTLHEKNMVVKGEYFTNSDMAYVMMHMAAAYEVFDDKMEHIFKNATVGKEIKEAIYQ